ncbi:hypothetical protein ACP4OV_028663 [Aristida adscensionis]
MGRRFRVLLLGSSAGGKILLATSGHRVFAYDPRSNAAERVFYMENFMDAPDEPRRPNEYRLLLNIAMHEESVTGVGHRRTAAGDDGGRVKMKLSGGKIAMREGPAGERRNKCGVGSPRFIEDAGEERAAAGVVHGWGGKREERGVRMDETLT